MTTAESWTTHGDFRSLLPQRYPNLLVDRVTRCEPGMVIETVKAVSGCEPCYADLTAGLPEDAWYYPETLLLDSFAQSAALLWARTRAHPFDGMPVLAGARGVTFVHPVLPGTVLRTVVKLIPGTETTMFFRGRSCVVDGPEVLAVDNLVLAIRRTDTALHSVHRQ